MDAQKDLEILNLDDFEMPDVDLTDLPEIDLTGLEDDCDHPPTPDRFSGLQASSSAQGHPVSNPDRPHAQNGLQRLVAVSMQAWGWWVSWH
jgi:hypothetical protein